MHSSYVKHFHKTSIKSLTTNCDAVMYLQCICCNNIKHISRNRPLAVYNENISRTVPDAKITSSDITKYMQ
jgi:hypothetical protein